MSMPYLAACPPFRFSRVFAPASRPARALARLTPMAAALALACAAAPAQAQAGGAWFATQSGPGSAAMQPGTFRGMPTANGRNNAASQQAAARKTLARSIDNLNRTVGAIAAQQGAQAAARAAAQAAASDVPDGLAPGGLWDRDAAGNTLAWMGAKRPVVTRESGRHTVTIEQTGSRAILNWDTFNVGRDTTVAFAQQSSDAVLNKVQDPLARPSQIQGRIEAAGTVMIVNRNGIVFGGGSQVNVRNLVAAAADHAIGDDRFFSDGQDGPGLYDGDNASFRNALGAVTVERGARIVTHTPGSVVDGGGYVMLLGQQVENAGRIDTPRGQALLAAGDSFVIRKGQVTDSAQGGTTYSTTRGNEVAPQSQPSLDLAAIDPAVQRGLVRNSGLILATEGDVTLAGQDVRLAGADTARGQPAGVAVATTSVNTRGTLHLLNSVSDAQGRVTLESGAVAAVVAGKITLDGGATGPLAEGGWRVRSADGSVTLEEDAQTALDSQRSALIQESARQDLLRGRAPELGAGGVFDNLGAGRDRRDQSRVDIVAGGVVDIQDAMVLATGGQVAITAGVNPAAGAGRVQLREGARLDVSGSVGVQLSMASNAVRVNIQGNELRDAPINRDSDKGNGRSLLGNLDVWVDRRRLVADDGLLYTSNGLLEVSGWVANQGHGIGEWTAQGGTVSLRGGQVLAQAGSAVNLAGGTVDVRDGYINLSWLRGADGRLYELSQAPADMMYSGLYQGYEAVHARWGDSTTRRFFSPLIAPARRWEPGYTVGRDAGQLILDTPTAVLQGDIVSDVYSGPRQRTGRDAALADSYLQSHYAVARRAELQLGRYGSHEFVELAGRLGGHHTDLRIGRIDAIDLRQEGSEDLQAPQDRAGTVWLDTAWLNAQGLGVLDLVVAGAITVGEAGAPASPALRVADGGEVRLAGANVDVHGAIVARGGRIVLSNSFKPTGVTGEGGAPVIDADLTPAGQHGAVTLGAGALLDVRGLWVNLLREPQGAGVLPWINGGSVVLSSPQDVTLSAGSVIDASAGAAIGKGGDVKAGKGGSVSLLAATLVSGRGQQGSLTMDGEIRAYGVEGAGSGTLRLQTGDAWTIGGEVLLTNGELAAGEVARIDMILAEPLVLRAGDIAPMDLAFTIDKLEAGETTTQEIVWSQNLPIPAMDVPVGAAWDISGLPNMTVYVVLADGNSNWYGTYGVRAPIPAGSRITSMYANSRLPAGYTIDPAVLPEGLPIQPVKLSVEAGSVMTRGTQLDAGTVLAAGTMLDRTVAVRPTVSWDADKWLQTGFSHYELRSRQGVAVADGARVHASAPVYRIDIAEAATAVVDGRDLAATARLLRDAPLFTESPAAGVLTQRAGASLTLLAGRDDLSRSEILSGGALYIGEGARVAVDPGQRVTLGAGSQLTVQGHIEAPGGSIELLHMKDKEDDPGFRPGGRSVWVGERAVLDAAGRAWSAVDSMGRRYGVVQAGGSIVLGSHGGDYLDSLLEAGLENAADAYVVIRPGALLDVSGAQAVFDVPMGGFAAWRLSRTDSGARASAPQTWATDGGQIEMRSYYGIYNEGMLRAHAGGPTAAGGELLLNLEALAYQKPSDIPYWENWTMPADIGAARIITVTQDAPAWRLAEGLRPGQADDSLRIGQASLAAEQVSAGGFDSLSLMGRSAIAFDGDVNLALGRSLTLRRGMLTASSPQTRVSLSAPYVMLDGQTVVSLLAPGGVTSTMPASPLGAALSIEGGLIDVRNRVQPQFDQVTLSSRGDLRFLAGTQIDADAGGQTSFLGVVSELVAPGDLTIVAGQTYPASGVQARIHAGFSYGVPMIDSGIYLQPVREAVLDVRRGDGATPPLPYSVFGSLKFTADQIRQGGVLRAPLGRIMLGADQYDFQYAPRRIELLPGSVTSVSAAGLAMPYGGTADGVAYTVDGIAPYTVDTLTNMMHAAEGIVLDNAARQGITLGGISIAAHQGSEVDLSGGGDLLGAAFMAGRGGSRDTLLHARRSGGRVYAIVPGAVTAPVAGGYYQAWTGGEPAIGQQVTLADGVPGLPPGTYTLLPANYALAPGAFRVELGPRMSYVPAGAMTLRDGSHNVAGTLGVAGTGIRDAQAVQVNIASGALVRTWSQYNETSYDAYQLSQAATFGGARPGLARDGKFLSLMIKGEMESEPGLAAAPLVFDGLARMNRDARHADAYGASLVLEPLYPQGGLVITAPGSTVQRDSLVLPISAEAINRIGAPNLYIGAGPLLDRNVIVLPGAAPTVLLESGAVLRGAHVVLAARESITLAPGAGIDTLGGGVAPPGTPQTGYFYGAGDPLLVASNGDIAMGESTDWRTTQGRITLGDGAFLRSEGSIGFLAMEGLNVEGVPRLATRKLELAVKALNVGRADVLSDVARQGLLPTGMNLDQDTLARLLAGDPATGAPAVERLTLAAGGSINFYGSVALSTYDAAGQSLLDELVLRTPSIYGWGTQQDAVRLSTDTLVWAGGTLTTAGGSVVDYYGATPGAFLENGAGTGSGSFEVAARRIVLGYPELDRPRAQVTFNRLMLGFSRVDLSAAEHILNNGTGNLSVYQTGANPTADYDAGAYAGSGGRLELNTPMLTGAAGSTFTWRAEALRVASPAGTPADTAAAGLGAMQTLIGNTLDMDGAVVLPSGRLVLQAEGNLTLGGNARLDLSGRAQRFFDLVQYGWGGDLMLESRHGNIVQAAGSVIDLSAAAQPAARRGDAQAAPVYHNDAGSLTLRALDGAAGAGRVQLDGTLLAHGGQGYDGGAIVLAAQQLGADAGDASAAFAALNETVNDGGFTASRRYALGRGNLEIAGDALRARRVEVSVDGGSLLVTGRIDASGERPGIIRLAARDDLTLAATAVLDARGTALQADSYGQAIDAKNRGVVELGSRDGWLRLRPGATLDLSTPDGVSRGDVQLNTFRTAETGGDVRIDAPGSLNIHGARHIALNAFWRYSPTDAAGTIVQDNGAGAGMVVNSDGVLGLDQIDARTVSFMNAAAGNAGLVGRTAGLAAFGAAYQLRPGVEIDSAGTPDGKLTVQGDIDLSRYRYGPLADRDPLSAAYGAGVAGSFVLRAEQDLDIRGNISDGFGVPASGLDVRIIEQDITLDAELVIDRAGLVLGAGAALPTSGSVNFDLVAGRVGWNSSMLRGGAVVPFAFTTSGYANLQPGTVITANVYSPDGTLVWAANTTLTSFEQMQPGYRIDPGFTVPAAGMVAPAVTVPAGTDLSIFSALYLGRTELPLGARLPVGTQVVTLSQPATVWAAAPMLAAGSDSWSLRVVAGADLAAADARAVRPEQALSGAGNLRLDNPFIGESGRPVPSVVRTGTGRLELLAGGDLTLASSFGIYTAGTQIDLPSGLALPTGAYLSDGGGDLYVAVQGDLSGYAYNNSLYPYYNDFSVNNWMVRRGDAETGEAALWAVRYGQYLSDGNATRFYGFSGLGTLGGGNVGIEVGGDAGVLALLPDDGGGPKTSQGLRVVVGGGGYVTQVSKDGSGAVRGGTLVQTGGGDLDIQVAGRFNPVHADDMYNANAMVGDDFHGTLVNLRGNIDLAAGSIGQIVLQYGSMQVDDPRAFDPYRAVMLEGAPRGGPVLVLGDAKARLRTRGDLVLGGVGDPGFVANGGPVVLDGHANSQFSLWRPETAIDLESAGGNLVPLNTYSVASDNEDWRDPASGVSTPMLPARFRAVAASGSLYYGGGQLIELAPSSGVGRLELLAWDSLYGASLIGASSQSPEPAARWLVSGARADADSIPNPFKPRLTGGSGAHFFAYGRDTVTAQPPQGEPIRIYAVEGDLLNVALGGELQRYDSNTGTYYSLNVAARPARVLAGRDIVNFGRGAGGDAGSSGLILNGDPTDVSMLSAGRDIFYANFQIGGPGTLEVTAGGNIYQGNTASITSVGPVVEGDVRPGASIVVQAGAGAAGPDWAALAALYLDPERQADTRPGYPLADQPGKVAQVYSGELTLAAWLRQQFGYTGDEAGAQDFLARQEAGLNAALATDGKPVRDLRHEYAEAGQPYLVNWLRERYADPDTRLRFADDGAPVVFEAAGMDARAFFGRLAPEQQRVFLREVYFAELRAGGREYNDADSTRYGSYLRGRQAIAALFPVYAVPDRVDAQGNWVAAQLAEQIQSGVAAQSRSGVDPAAVLDANGVPYAQRYAVIQRGGDFTMFQGDKAAGQGNGSIRTVGGGHVQMLVPAGQIVVGVEGVLPNDDPAMNPAGLITQGRGDIRLYAQDSVLLGLSRIMTTFGGHIQAWSAKGDINAGRGSKTTLVYTPPRRVYDAVGNVTLSPQVPSSGAGIATLNPIPEVPPGDVDLIAPLGTIDAGEAGIRVSGNVNLAAMQVVNAANIQVQGESKGIPVVAAVNTGALTSASAAATSAATAAQDAVSRTRAAAQRALPSIISVQILGFGGDSAGGAAPRGNPAPAPGAASGTEGGRADRLVRVLGRGQLADAEKAQLTADERQHLGM